MKKIKLLFITQDLAVGGGTSSLSALYLFIRKQFNIDVLLLAHEGDASVSYKDCIKRPCLFTDLYYRNIKLTHGMIRYMCVAVKLICRFLSWFMIDIDKLHVCLNNSLLQNYNCVISYGEGVATLFTQHIHSSHKIAWIHYEASKYPYNGDFYNLYKRFDRIVTVSETIAEGVAKTYPTLADRIVGIHNIIDIERIHRLSKEYIPEKFDKNVTNIISLGRLSFVKRFPEIPRIAANLKKAGLIFKWRIYGPNATMGELEKIQSNIKKYNVADCVEYCGSRINPYPYLASSDLFVILSTSEACPMVITEARALNIPIVSTDYTTAPEFIKNGFDGIIAPIDSISDAIISVISNKKLKSKLLVNSDNRLNNNTIVLERFKNILVK